jgi:phosphoribosylaminoimidazolecarboxamide formyltransferase/IMP cyclohydrolase
MSVNVVRDIDRRVKIRRVLLSVSDKSGLDALVPALVEINPEIRFYSTGGTFSHLASILGPEKTSKHLTQVSDYTGQPETQGGLVKTLDFKIYLGLLTETYNDHHQADLRRTGAHQIDMVVVNLYPFRQTVARTGVTPEEARSNIDIGGPCMIRAAAKNYHRVASVTDPADYPAVVEMLRKGGGSLDLEARFNLAKKAFAHTAEYDAAIAKHLAGVKQADLEKCHHFRDM